MLVATAYTQLTGSSFK